MVEQAVFLTLILIGIAIVGLLYLLRPVIARCVRYVRALDARDEEAARESSELKRLRELAERELDSGAIAPEDDHGRGNGQSLHENIS